MTPVILFTVGDILVIVLLGIVVLVAGFIWLSSAIQRNLCKHDGGVNETHSCDAICRKCGKNLGFIGTWRDSKKEKQS